MKPGTFIALTVACTLSHWAAAYGQDTLPAVIVTAANYKYLKIVGGKEVAAPVRKLERMAASYDIRNSEYYEEDYDSYFISFYLPEGVILAAYDKDGRLLRTAEKYHDIQLPPVISGGIAAAFPNWTITRDVYRVNYFDDSGKAVKRYKVVLKRGGRRMRVEMNERGEVVGGG
ncbi:MAG TPA: hypothetical protein VHE34_02790 [Puia sp.]|jgi:hypothetical protein|uniref:nicotinate-nucleotide adenylyltransferase n=1 Tax=Puia sp. TaxID=2045100 RepID=UPI002B5DD959|nr:nicotinate-nucleotide adenylyltransferase [Puia sp.]HVU94116.1 hypothetical protein [Puia sp.]